MLDTTNRDASATTARARDLQLIPVVTTADLRAQLDAAAARGDADTYHTILAQLPTGMQPIGVDGDLIVYGEVR